MEFHGFGFGSGSSIRQEKMEITQFPREVTGEWLAKPYQNAEVPGTVIRSGTVLLQAPILSGQ